MRKIRRVKYRIIWVNTAKNRQERCDVNDQNIALVVAKQNVSLGTQNVIIQVYENYDGDILVAKVDHGKYYILDEKKY